MKELEPRKFGPRNLKYNIFGTGRRKKLVITIDLSKIVGVSQSGKSIVIATTGGNMWIPEIEDCKLSVNVFKPRIKRRRL